MGENEANGLVTISIEAYVSKLELFVFISVKRI